MAENRTRRGTANSSRGLNAVDGDNLAGTEMSEDVLVSRCRAGNMAAFGQLIEMYQDRLFNAIFRMVSN